MLAAVSRDTIYMLISQTGHPISLTQTSSIPQPKPRIIKWNLANDRRGEVIQIAEGAASVSEECWNFVANSTFTTFYVLGTQPVYVGPARDSRGELIGIPGGWEFGSYSSAEYTNTINSKVRVNRVQNAQTTPVRDLYLNPNSSGISNVLPQLSTYYHLGDVPATPFELRQGNLPDSRRNMYLHTNGELYYGFAINDRFGIAKATAVNTAQRVITVNSDRSFNSSSFALYIDEANSHAYLAFSHINKSTNSSRAKIVRGNI